jgi:hypothetical protein
VGRGHAKEEYIAPVSASSTRVPPFAPRGGTGLVASLASLMTPGNPLAVEPLLRRLLGPMRRRFIPARHAPIIRPASSGVSKVLMVRWMSLRNIDALTARRLPAACSPGNERRTSSRSAALLGLHLPNPANPSNEFASRPRSVSVRRVRAFRMHRLSSCVPGGSSVEHYATAAGRWQGVGRDRRAHSVQHPSAQARFIPHISSRCSETRASYGQLRSRMLPLGVSILGSKPAPRNASTKAVSNRRRPGRAPASRRAAAPRALPRSRATLAAAWAPDALPNRSSAVGCASRIRAAFTPPKPNRVDSAASGPWRCVPDRVACRERVVGLSQREQAALDPELEQHHLLEAWPLLGRVAFREQLGSDPIPD